MPIRVPSDHRVHICVVGSVFVDSEGLIVNDTTALMKSEIVNQIRRLGPTSPQKLERAVFELLLHASRVGPKLAQTILSGIEAGPLVQAIREGDHGSLCRVPGVGAKTAERIVVELRDRVDGLEVLAPAPSAGAAATAAGADEGLRAELVSALLNLQIQRQRAERVADEVIVELDEAEPIEVLVRAALRRMAR